MGRTLARRLLDRGELTGPSGGQEPIERVVLFDAVVPEQLPAGLDDRAELVAGDVADARVVRSVIDDEELSVFHLASMVSAGCEADFDGAWRVNLDGCRAVLEACRARPEPCRLVFSSSIAAFGGAGMPEVVSDATKQTPQTTYGATKAICELLVNDYTRKGFVDGRSARLPTVIVRPGKPNAAASSWVSGVFREPLNGQECIVPVEPSTRAPVSGYRTVVDNLVRLHEVSPAALDDDRAIGFPSLDVTLEQMTAALHKVADRPLGPVRLQPDPMVMAIFRGWAQRASSQRAMALGLVRDESLEAIVRAYIEDFLPPPVVS